MTSGYQGGLYQAEIPIGVVSHIYPKQGNLNEIIDVRPAVDFTALEFVLIVTNG
jgi:cell shape-determining protein MreC